MLDEQDQRALREVAQSVRYGRDQPLCKEGERSQFAVVIQRGWVKISSMSSNRSRTTLALRGPCDLVGENAAADQPRAATVIALTEVWALRVAAAEFTEFLAQSPGAALALQRTDRERRVESDRRRMDVRTLNSDQRLARLLLELADDVGRVDVGVGGNRELVLELPLSQAEYGQLISAATVMVERALRKWRQRGLVTTDRRRLTLHDLPALRRIAGQSY
jgi:CRP/FNR family cyclic AMP-dependent transcriptional regulator